MPSITVPEGFSYVTAAMLSTVYLCAWQTSKVGRARKAAGIKYPYVYAEKAEAEVSDAAMKFNCTQRAHQNTLEALPLVLTTTLITGLKYPVASAAICGTWVLGRIIYTLGYSTGIPAKRNANGGMLGSLAAVASIGASSYTVFKFITEGI